MCNKCCVQTIRITHCRQIVLHQIKKNIQFTVARLMTTQHLQPGCSQDFQILEVPKQPCSLFLAPQTPQCFSEILKNPSGNELQIQPLQKLMKLWPANTMRIQLLHVALTMAY
ncbi:hypothetical protein GDO81_017609 [Engystomops pustulosus]|uniref:Uncharacterized protein n=1 Tax=Engystomops pustulosus TaxID=76066 RepID=A0AAV7AAU2_ENGPU|nr:hypothetical protein GDO81_017609 [Engystomops pustulosus]